MKLLIEINTADQATLDEALALVSLYKLKLEQPVTEEKPATKPTKPKAKPATKPKPEPAEEETVETPPAEEPVDEGVDPEVTLTDLKKAAKEASGRTDRETVMGVIKRYGGKLASVTENNYGALFNDLSAL